MKYPMSDLIFQYTYELLGEYVIQRKCKSRVGYSRHATRKHYITIHVWQYFCHFLYFLRVWRGLSNDFSTCKGLSLGTIPLDVPNTSLHFSLVALWK